MTRLYAEPVRGDGWIIADRAGVNQRPGMVYLTKRAAVADIRAIYNSRVEIVAAETTKQAFGRRVTNFAAADLRVYPEVIAG